MYSCKIFFCVFFVIACSQIKFGFDFFAQAGVGRFQYALLVAAGLGLAADTVELFVVAYVIPSAEVELCMTGHMKGWLGQ